ncbi:MAG: c-type cytochrome [Acidobacteria bacterium]|nr:c-type cytochrome [Acidobacteriota bacterium]
MSTPKKSDHAHDIGKLNVIFGVTCCVLVVVMIWMVLDDYTREWKDYQRQFNRLDMEKTRREVAQARAQVDRRKIQELQKQRQEAEKRIEQKRKDYEVARHELAKAEAEWYEVDQDQRFAKATYDSLRYDYEVAREEKRGSAQKLGRELAETEKGLADLTARLDAATARKDSAQARVNEYVGQIAVIGKEMAGMRFQQTRLQQKVERLQTNPVFYVRNAPMLDFMNPSLDINQYILDNLHMDINFMTIPRVDRCTTCHLAIDQKGYENMPQPFRSHPRLDLFLAADSPHPIDSVGCTSCHLGRDRGTTFGTAAHTPRDAKQEEQWKKKYHWHPMHRWDYPMLTLNNVEASCYKCHASESYVQGADRLNTALRLFEQSGCFGCHKVKGFEELRKTGPDLKYIASKVDKDWTYKWIESPREFRHTRMPQFFHLTNTNTPEDRARSQVEIHSMVEYLFSVSERLKYSLLKGGGSAPRGQELVNTLGCLGCHVVGEPGDNVQVADRRLFGPNLAGMGSKTTREWIYHWIKDPSHYFSRTYMPRLRLSDQEALDITAYLASLRNPEFEKRPVPKIDPKLRDDVALYYLHQHMREKEAREELQKMSDGDKDVLIGQRAIQQYGCFGCHDIRGFERAQSVGVELTEEGSKLLDRLDFGFARIEHTKAAWFFQKLKDPRIFDVGKVKRREEKLKMPNFHFTDREASHLVTVLLSFTKERVPAEARKVLDAREAQMEAGRRLIKSRNCQACHVLENTGGDIFATIADSGLRPPILEPEGEKVKSEWLFRFLKEPSPIRPWLKVRMPTFDFTDTELNNIVTYFASRHHQVFPYVTYDYRFPPEQVAAGRHLFTVMRCLNCHFTGTVPAGVSAEDLAPDLTMARERLRPDWIVRWMEDPQKIQPGTRMPTYYPEGKVADQLQGILKGDAGQQILAMRDYVLTLGGRSQSVPARAGGH